MARYHVNLEVGSDGSCMARVIELPGCFAIGPNREQTLDRLRPAIASYVDFLKRHGEQLDEGAVEIEVAEEASVAGSFPGTPGDQVARFASDRESPSKEEIERALHWLDCSREELMGLFDGLSREAIEWRPPDSNWTIRQMLEHIAGAEAAYLTRLEPERSGYHFGLLRAVRGWSKQRLRAITEEEGKAVRLHRGEEWTARKVLRRFLEHEQEHLVQLRELVKRYRQSQPPCRP